MLYINMQVGRYGADVIVIDDGGRVIPTGDRFYAANRSEWSEAIAEYVQKYHPKRVYTNYTPYVESEEDINKILKTEYGFSEPVKVVLSDEIPIKSY